MILITSRAFCRVSGAAVVNALVFVIMMMDYPCVVLVVIEYFGSTPKAFVVMAYKKNITEELVLRYPHRKIANCP